jgi:hypothetical protein
MSKRILLPYNEARPHILDADVLLYRGKSMFARAINALTRSEYSHAGLAGWANGPDCSYGRLLCHEMVLTGGRITPLSAHAEKWPGCIDVYRVQDTHASYRWDPTSKIQITNHEVLFRKNAVAEMRDLCRPGEYGWLNLAWSSLYYIPFIRFFLRPPTNDQLENKKLPPYCSQAVAYALRKSFTDVVRNTPDCFTQPIDLSRSPLLHYMFTLDAPPPPADDCKCRENPYFSAIVPGDVPTTPAGRKVKAEMERTQKKRSEGEVK